MGFETLEDDDENNLVDCERDHEGQTYVIHPVDTVAIVGPHRFSDKKFHLLASLMPRASCATPVLLNQLLKEIR